MTGLSKQGPAHETPSKNRLQTLPNHAQPIRHPAKIEAFSKPGPAHETPSKHQCQNLPNWTQSMRHSARINFWSNSDPSKPDPALETFTKKRFMLNSDPSKRGPAHKTPSKNRFQVKSRQTQPMRHPAKIDDRPFQPSKTSRHPSTLFGPYINRVEKGGARGSQGVPKGSPPVLYPEVAQTGWCPPPP